MIWLTSCTALRSILTWRRLTRRTFLATSHVTPSVHGGVVKDPVYRKYTVLRRTGRRGSTTSSMSSSWSFFLAIRRMYRSSCSPVGRVQ